MPQEATSEEEEVQKDGTNRSYKCRLSRVFRQKDVEFIKQTVQAMHPAVCQTTLLIKHRYLEDVGNGGAPTFDMNEEAFRKAFATVTSEHATKVRKSRKSFQDVDIEKQQRQLDSQRWKQSFDRMMVGVSSDAIASLRDVENYSVSTMASLAARQYISNLCTNIRYKFKIYVKRCVRTAVEEKARRLWEMDDFGNLPKNARKHWNEQIRRLSNDILLVPNRPDSSVDEFLHGVRDRMMRGALPPGVLQRRRGNKNPIDQDMNSAKKVLSYLRPMVKMCCFLEMFGRKLPSPLPVKTSFIPSHYTIDTSSLCQLLFREPGQVKKFARFFEHSVNGGFNLPNLKSKANVCSSLASLSGRAVDASEEELFMDAVWAYFTRFKGSAKRHRPLRAATKPSFMFDHSISTDGYSVSFLVTNRSVRGRKTFSNVGNTQYDADKQEEFSWLTVENAKEHQHLLDDSLYTLVGGDPGKATLLRLVGRGHHSRKSKKTLRYTKKQRDFETHRRARSRRCSTPPDIGLIEKCQPFSSKSCVLTNFWQYVRYRTNFISVLRQHYEQTKFRWSRFLAWSARKLSLERFTKQIQDVFGVDKQIVVLYGSWGRQPNLKHQAPSPGIGLRRLIHATAGITTITVNESYTSSYCCRCQCSVANIKGHKHHLLQCGNPKCNTFWDRDILGALNILAKGIHLLTSGTPHPNFGG